MDLLSLFISGLGLLLSIYAIYTAINAKAAVDGTIKKMNLQKDIAEVGDILQKLDEAKFSASIWVPGAVKKSQMGRNRFADLRVVRLAEDALAVWVPTHMSKASADRMEAALENLRKYCDGISAPDNDENLWSGVVVSTQSLTRILREHSRALENSQLASTS